MKTTDKKVQQNYENAKEVFGLLGVDTEKAIANFSKIKLSLHNWQGDDVKGFDTTGNESSQNLVTGSYPGSARNGDEMRKDIDTACMLSPLKHKINLHSMYAENGGKRNAPTFSDFSRWTDWAKEKGYGIDFNTSFFTHKMMDGNLSLTSLKQDVRNYWIEAGQAGREISNQIGQTMGQICVNNIWVPDGMKDVPASRLTFRSLLTDSLNKIREKKYDVKNTFDVLEGKLFSIGSESFTAGSHDFYLAYALKNGCGVTMDTGHYHLTENVADKISAVAPFMEGIMLHISRGVRWDSDHVVVQSDELLQLFEEITRGDFYNKIYLGLDYFDASINRVAAWAIGARAVAKSILTAFLQPYKILIEKEQNNDYTARLLLMEEIKNLPFNAVWEYLLLQKEIPSGQAFLNAIKDYEKTDLNNRT